MTLQEPKTSTSADSDAPDTDVMVAPTKASPVFVDSTGRRRRLLRRASYAFGGICMLYGGLVSVSLAGGPVSPNSVLPLPALADGGTSINESGTEARPSPSPMPTPAESTAAPAKRVISSDALPRRAAAATHVLERAPAPKPPAAKPKPSRPTPSKSAPTSRPVESASASPTSAPPSTTPTATASPTSKAPPPPKPPSVDEEDDTGGTGGGEEVEAVEEIEPAAPTVTVQVTTTAGDAGKPSPSSAAPITPSATTPSRTTPSATTPSPTSSAGGAGFAA